MSKRIITFGKWNDQPIEWVVLKEDNFQLLVISRWAIMKRRFDGSSSGKIWENSELRLFLQKEFYENAFTAKEKRQIVNTKLKDVGDTKDNVFILSRSEMDLLTDDEYEARYYKSCGYCTWTRTQVGNYGYVWNGFAKGCWCMSKERSYSYISNSLSYSLPVRPAMFLKKPANGTEGFNLSN